MYLRETGTKETKMMTYTTDVKHDKEKKSNKTNKEKNISGIFLFFLFFRLSFQSKIYLNSN